MKLERLRIDLEKARQKAAEWQARARDLERQITEQENLEIVQAVRSIQVSPEELREILGKLRNPKALSKDVEREKDSGRVTAGTESESVGEDEKSKRVSYEQGGNGIQ